MSADRVLVDGLGWAATAVFVGSYFLARPESLVRTQIVGALMWVAYGVLMRAPPVVAANLLVMAAAGWKARRSGRSAKAAAAASLAASPNPSPGPLSVSPARAGSGASLDTQGVRGSSISADGPPAV